MHTLLCIVGSSGSGKTTLIERLIPMLRQRGYRVGCIKHDAHSFTVDYPGKDTWRFQEAGSEWVAIANDQRVAIMGQVPHTPSLDTIASFFPDTLDIILVEGYRHAGKPRIEVVRAACNPEPRMPLDDLDALVTDVVLDAPCPLFALDDVTGIALFIERHVLGEDRKSDATTE